MPPRRTGCPSQFRGRMRGRRLRSRRSARGSQHQNHVKTSCHGTVILTFSGHPTVENGQRPDENQVSRTSSSCSKVKFLPFVRSRAFAFSRASASVLPATQLAPSEVYVADRQLSQRPSIPGRTSWDNPSTRTKYTGHRCPHHSCREMHQS